MTLIKLIISLGILFLLACAGLLGYQLWQEYHIPKPGPSQAMIVLGAQVTPAGQPSVQLALRLEAALQAYKAAPMTIVVCGGRGQDEPTTEASVMKAWLVSRGVPGEHILMDENSVNTQQNIQAARDLLPLGAVNVLIITSDYHLPRAMAIARDLGLQPGGIGSPILPEYWIKNHARETLAWGKYLVNKFLPFVPTE
ncbi:MAG: YdcF family protein [Christensenellales bacterium]